MERTEGSIFEELTMAITSFDCECGNNDPGKALEYEGSLGYEAIVWKVCGSYSDFTGAHHADSWRLEFAGLSNKPDTVWVSYIN